MSYVPLSGDSFQPQPNQSATAPIPSSDSFGGSQPPHQGQGQPPHQGQGQPPYQGQGQPPYQGQGQPPYQGHSYPPADSYGGAQPPHQDHSYPSVPGHPAPINPHPEHPQYPGYNPPGAPVNYSQYPGYSPYPGAQPVYNYPGYSHDGKPIHQHVEWSRGSQEVYCHHCNTLMWTQTHTSVGAANWLVCAGIALVGCWFGCCFIPFCIDGLKDYTHNCGHCGKTLKVIKPIG